MHNKHTKRLGRLNALGRSLQADATRNELVYVDGAAPIGIQ